MIKRIVALFAGLLLLSACNSCHKAGHHSGASESLAAEFERTAGDRVFFALNKHDLSEHSKETLKKQAEWLKSHEKLAVTIEGHCDERGTKEYNIALGEKRAQAVKMYLVHMGVGASRIETISYGKERPAVIGDDESAWSQNRRGITSIR